MRIKESKRHLASAQRALASAPLTPLPACVCFALSLRVARLGLAQRAVAEAAGERSGVVKAVVRALQAQPDNGTVVAEAGALLQAAVGGDGSITRSSSSYVIPSEEELVVRPSSSSSSGRRADLVADLLRAEARVAQLLQAVARAEA